MAEPVKIAMANTEYQAYFARPCLSFVGDGRQRAIEAIFTALLHFNLRLENTEIVTAGTLADYKIIFRIPERGIRFQFGAEEYRYTKDYVSWATSDDDGHIFLAAERALMEGSNAEVKSCTVTVAMHLQPLTKPREDLLAPFFPEPYKVHMAQRRAQTYGHHIRWADGNVLLDFSVGFANGIFVRFSSDFHGHPPFPEVLAKIQSDQEALFAMLGIEEAGHA